MTSIGFPEQNIILAKDQPEYLPLPGHIDGDGQFISCYRLSWRERLKMLVTGRLWLRVLTFGQRLQPQARLCRSKGNCMQIIAHRGYWREPSEQNTIGAFARALSNGFGVETDIRNWFGLPVLLHDPITREDGGATVTSLEQLFQLYTGMGSNRPLALNVKEDGLQDMVMPLIAKYKIENYFVFDMSAPDTRRWLERGAKTYLRCSEEETIPTTITPIGVWVDLCTRKSWNDADADGWRRTNTIAPVALVIGNYAEHWRVPMCVVSPELNIPNQKVVWHKDTRTRDGGWRKSPDTIEPITPDIKANITSGAWDVLKRLTVNSAINSRVSICTDFPKEAHEFINGKD